MPKKKKKPVGDKTLKSINIAHLKRQMEELEAKGREEYKPKIGRQIANLKKKIKNLG